MTPYLGIDIGTTFLKGAVLDLDRPALGAVRRVPMPAPVAGLPPGLCELDPASLLAACRTLIAELLDETPTARGLVVCGQMHGLVLTDRAAGPRSNIVTWQDRRALDPSVNDGGTVFDELLRLVPVAERRATGGELRLGVPITTLYWLNRHRQLPPGLFAVSLPDFMLANLCGVEPTTEPTNAAATGLLDLDTLDWHRGLLDRLGLDALRMPRLRRFGEAVGTLEIDGRRLTAFTPVGDQQCALAGVGLDEGELSVNLATGGQISLLSGSRYDGGYQVRPYFDGRWLQTAVEVPAGQSLAGLVDLVRAASEGGASVGDTWQRITAEVAGVGATDFEVNLGLLADPAYRAGLVADVRDGRRTAGEVFVAAFRWMADEYQATADALSPGQPRDRVVFSGGLARRFPRLRQEILDRFGGVPHRLCVNAEDTMHGLLALALVCSGQAGTVAEATRIVNAAGC